MSRAQRRARADTGDPPDRLAVVKLAAHAASGTTALVATAINATPKRRPADVGESKIRRLVPLARRNTGSALGRVHKPHGPA